MIFDICWEKYQQTKQASTRQDRNVRYRVTLRIHALKEMATLFFSLVYFKINSKKKHGNGTFCNSRFIGYRKEAPGFLCRTANMCHLQSVPSQCVLCKSTTENLKRSEAGTRNRNGSRILMHMRPASIALQCIAKVQVLKLFYRQVKSESMQGLVRRHARVLGNADI